MKFYGFRLINNSCFPELDRHTFIHFAAKDKSSAWKSLSKILVNKCKCENVTELKVQAAFELATVDEIAKASDLIKYLEKLTEKYGDLPLMVNGSVVIDLSDFFFLDSEKGFINIDSDF